MQEEIRSYEREIETIEIKHIFKDRYVAEISLNGLEYPFKTGLMTRDEAQKYFVEYKIGGIIWIQIEKNKKGFWEITKKAAAAPKMETAKELNDKQNVKEETIDKEEMPSKNKGVSELRTKIWISREKTIQEVQFEPIKIVVGIQKGFDERLTNEQTKTELKKLRNIAIAEIDEQLKSTVRK